MRSLRIVPIVVLALASTLTMSTGAGASSRVDGHRHGHHGYVCTGGNVPSGYYESLTIKGICYLPLGTVVVGGGLWIAPGALLDAVTPGDPASAPILPGNLIVWGDVTVGKGAVLAAGCSPLGGCTGVARDHIYGSIRAWGAEAVLLQEVAVSGSVSIIGGGGGAEGGAGSGGCFAPSYAIPAPWSEDASLSNPTTGSPQYTDLEDSTIGGSLTIVGMQTCYLASFRDLVFGSVHYSGNTTSDPDGNEFASNHVWGNLSCHANAPAIHYGDSAGVPDVVQGWASGQCGFSVLSGNPTTPEHLSVPGWKLKTYAGTHSASPVKSLSFGTTAAGDALSGVLGDATLAGAGLTGTATFDPSQPLGSTGEVEVISTRPDGSSSFEVIINCACMFDGQSGAATIFAYGTTTSSGLTTGRFLIGGSGGGLAALAGWGLFTSAGEPSGTLAVTEHLALT